jgi:hypothetical protein
VAIPHPRPGPLPLRQSVGSGVRKLTRLGSVATRTGDSFPSSKLMTQVDSYVETIKTTKKGK